MQPARDRHEAESPPPAAVARRLLQEFGGRYSTELGIDVDANDAEIERWFLAATLFGTRITASTAERTFLVLSRAGISSINDAAARPRDQLVALLDEGGYARYDFRTADLMKSLARAIAETQGNDLAGIGRRITDPQLLATALDDLPGWGPVTVGLFLRELRGVWPGATLPLDQHASATARRLGLFEGTNEEESAALAHLAAEMGCDLRDLEACLVRADLAHRHRSS